MITMHGSPRQTDGRIDRQTERWTDGHRGNSATIRSMNASRIGVILGGYEGYAYPPLFGVGGTVPPHFLGAVTRKIMTQIQAFITEQDTNCQIGANSARRLLYTHAHLASAAAGILLLQLPWLCTSEVGVSHLVNPGCWLS